MKETALLKVSLIVSLLGILLLLFIVQKIDVSPSIISQIDQNTAGSTATITGIVSEVTTSNKTVIFNVAQLDKMMVVVFDNISLQKGDYVEVTGKIQEYNGKPELIADKIVLK